MRKLSVLLLFLACGCASNIMRGYIGQPLQEAMVDYGAPSAAFDMGDGRRAFQWEMTSTSQRPTYVRNSGNAVPVGNSVWWTQNTQISGGGISKRECVYTLYGRWDESASLWRIESFEEPSFFCE